jgi:hypothetical protein
MRRHLTIIAALVWVLVSGSKAMADTSVSINLGESSQNYAWYGIENNGGIGYWYIQQGNCSAAAGNTQCNLSGNFTGSTPGFTSGTYDLVTTFSGTTPVYISPYGTFAPSPLVGGSVSAALPNQFEFVGAFDNAVMTLDLTASDGTMYSIPILSGGSFENGAGFNVFLASFACTDVTGACDLIDAATDGNLSGTAGVIQGPVTGNASFLLSSATVTPPTPSPEPGVLVLSLSALGLIFAGKKLIALGS